MATREMPNPKLASVRTHNPGAQWPNEMAKRFGMTGFESLRDGHGNKIAIFPTAIQGAASNMALLDQAYCGLTVAAAEKKWSGNNRGGLPGFPGTTVITKAMCSDPQFMIAFMKATANAEAPNGANALTDAEWQSAYDLYHATIYGRMPAKTSAKPGSRLIETKPPAQPPVISQEQPQSLWSRVTAWLSRMV